LALPSIQGDSWLDSSDVRDLLQYGLPVKNFSQEQLVISKLQRKAHRQSTSDGNGKLADSDAVIAIQPPLPPSNQNPFAQRSTSIFSPLSNARQALTSSITCLFEEDAAAVAVDSSGRPPRRKKPASIVDRLSCAAPRDSNTRNETATGAHSNGLLSAVFVACGGARREPGVGAATVVTSPPSEPPGTVVAVRKQKGRDKCAAEVDTPDSSAEVAGTETLSVDEMDV
jgi:hypothetical protein